MYLRVDLPFLCPTQELTDEYERPRMGLLDRERATLNEFMPGLDEFLAGSALSDLESPGSKAIAEFRNHGGPALLVPAEHSGRGATALQALRIQRAIGSRSPSLAVATTMHHFSVASLVALSEVSAGMEWMLLEGIATGNLLLASGFAEGRTDGGILRPTMQATVTDDGVRLTGVKRPCSLARSMDLLTASVQVPRLDGHGDQLAVAMIPAQSDGVSVTPFWSSFVLAGAESDQVSVDDVLVPAELLVRTEVSEGEHLDDIQTAGFVWFELLMMGSYLGAATALVERVLDNERVPESERLRLVVEIEGAMAAAENIARQIPQGQRDRSLLADSLFARYAIQGAIGRVVPQAVELLGGLNFISSDDTAYLAAAVNGLGFHPPSRAKMAAPLLGHLAGAPLEIV
jgi:alkylation response protein AidB-like acyl-CoA dehydrogenase